MCRPGAQLGEKYRIVEILGDESCDGEDVCLVEDERLHCHRIARRYSDGDFPEEMILFRNVDHVSLPRVIDIVRDPEGIWLVEDYFSGVPLSDYWDGLSRQENAMEEQKKTVYSLVSVFEELVYRGAIGNSVSLPMEYILITEEGEVKLKYPHLQMEAESSKRTKRRGKGRFRSRGIALRMGYDLLCELHLPLPLRLRLLVSVFSQRDPKSPARHLKCGFQWFRRYQVPLVLLGIILLTAVFLLCNPNVFKDDISTLSYEQCLSYSQSISHDMKMTYLQQALHLDPMRPDAYECMLDSFDREGSFSEEESRIFLSYFYTYLYDTTSDPSPEYTNLILHAGISYFRYYEVHEKRNISECVERAYPFLLEYYCSVPEDSMEQKAPSQEGLQSQSEETTSLLYFRICSLYRELIGSIYHDRFSVGSAVSSMNEKEVWESLEQLLPVEGEISSYDCLVADYTIMCVLFDQRAVLKRMEVSLEQVLQLYDRAALQAEERKVSRDRTGQLRDLIVSHKEAWRTGIVEEYEYAGNVETGID